MDLHSPTAEIFIPDQLSDDAALRRTTHMGIGAHQDDLEIMAYHGILECFGRLDRYFAGVTVTNGAGSPRSGLYANYSDEEMRAIRRLEQKKAALIGEYGVQILLDYTSAAVKDSSSVSVVDDLKKLISACSPEFIYTHNLADKHDTHVAVTLRVIQALRELPEDVRPKAVYGCEVWRDLDWLPDRDKIVFDVSGRDNLAAALISVFDSQIAGGKRYDLAALGRRIANATYSASHATDVSQAVIFAMDLTPLMNDSSLNPRDYVASLIERFARDVAERITEFI